jgi:phenylpyruvate tautomerase PptA (4-oxalocrotonate tautomerase family)
MPLWKVYHPVGAFTAEDKKALAQRVTEVYASIPIPKFYVVFIFEEIAENCITSLFGSRSTRSPEQYPGRCSESGG